MANCCKERVVDLFLVCCYDGICSVTLATEVIHLLGETIMTVKELIEKLQMFDENLIIAIPNKDRDEDNPYPYVFNIGVTRGVSEGDHCLYLFEQDKEYEVTYG